MRIACVPLALILAASMPARVKAAQPPRILIVCDMEGVSGVTTPDYQRADRPAQYAEGRRALTADVNAAIRGLKAGGAGAIWVQDGHGSGNEDEPDILLDQMDKRANFDFRPYPFEPYGTGLDASVDAVVYIGAHARAFTPGFMAHTFFYDVTLRVNGIEFSETHVLALSASRWGIPVIMATGDDVLKGQLSEDFPELEYAVVKTARSWSQAEPLPPAEAARRIEEAARRATDKFLAGRFRAYSLPAPYDFEISFLTTDEAARALGGPFTGFPKPARSGERAVRFAAASFEEGFQTSLAIVTRAVNPLPLLVRVLEHDPQGKKMIEQWQDLLNAEPGKLPEWAQPPPRLPGKRRYFGAS